MSSRREGQRQRAVSTVVSIAAFQAVDPGSNPGRRIFLILYPFPHYYYVQSIHCIDCRMLT